MATWKMNAKATLCGFVRQLFRPAVASEIGEKCTIEKHDTLETERHSRDKHVTSLEDL